MAEDPSILVVDDEPDNFDVIETLLDGEGYQLSYAPNGQQALNFMEVFQPSLILLDVMMPDLDGMTVCRELKAHPTWRTIPVVMVTALSSKEDLAQCIALGADDFISKPVNALELRARVRSMLRIKQQYDALQDLIKLREDMVNMIIHDLRNPLVTIRLASEILLHPAISKDKQVTKVQQILSAEKQLHLLVDSLLLMAKLEAGKLMLDYQETDLYTLCKSAVSDFEAIAAQKKLEFIFNLPEPGRKISVDIILFRRILDNLLSNAIKFSPSQSQVILSAQYLESGGIKIQVSDSGPGVSQEFKQNIFEKYEIGNLISGIQQTGLGLAFCKIAIEAHGGNITVDDNLPKGSIFTLELDQVHILAKEANLTLGKII